MSITTRAWDRFKVGETVANVVILAVVAAERRQCDTIYEVKTRCCGLVKQITHDVLANLQASQRRRPPVAAPSCAACRWERR
jgi:hypothetical protein